MKEQRALFAPGQIVYHKKFRYRGVIVDVDPVFSGTEEWYHQVARSHPPKDRPWYHVLVHDHTHQTYVAERHLEKDPTPVLINHPLIDDYFSSFTGSDYLPRLESS